MGVPRAVYWSCNVEFDPLVRKADDEENWPCTLLCDWITWPIRSWRQIDGLTLADSAGPLELEASLYFFNQHQPLATVEFSLRRAVANSFRVRGRLLGDLEDLDGRVFRGITANFEVLVEFAGLLVVPENLEPKLESEAQALQALRNYADLEAYEQPEWHDGKWLFRPKLDTAPG